MAGCDGAQKIIFSFSYSRPMVKAVNNEFLRPGDKEHLKNVQAIGYIVPAWCRPDVNSG